MPVIEITKQFVIDAIQKEPARTLRPGAWVRGEIETRTVRSRGCAVCAVGAVMRRALDPMQKAIFIERAALASVCHSTTSMCFSEQSALAYAESICRSGDHMGSLSVYFEWLGDQDGIPTTEIKQRVIAFVRDNFPDTLRIDIDGAKPARDAKVVKA